MYSAQKAAQENRLSIERKTSGIREKMMGLEPVSVASSHAFGVTLLEARRADQVLSGSGPLANNL